MPNDLNYALTVVNFYTRWKLGEIADMIYTPEEIISALNLVLLNVPQN